MTDSTSQGNPANVPLSRIRSFSLMPFCAIIFPLLNGFYNPVFLHDKGVFWAVDVITLTLFPLALLFLYGNRNQWVHAGFEWPRGNEAWFNFIVFSLGTVIIGPLLFAGLQTLILSTGVFHSRIFYNGNPLYLALDFGNFPKMALISYAALSAGILEELFFKGIFLKILLDRRLARRTAYLLLSLLFAATHWEQGIAGMISSFLYSYLSFYIFGYIKNLVPLILLHSAIDFVLLGVYVYGK